jgi:putative oxidoreductase
MDLALFGLRLVVGLTLAAHGGQKLFGWFGGRGIAGTAASYERLGLRPGRFNAWLAGLAEVLGGLLVAVGLLTPLGAAAVIGVMTTAALTVNLRNGFFVTGHGVEYNVVLMAAGFALAGAGAGGWSLDNALDLNLTGAGWALAALAAGVLAGVGAVFSGRLATARGVAPRDSFRPTTGP